MTNKRGMKLRTVQQEDIVKLQSQVTDMENLLGELCTLFDLIETETDSELVMGRFKIFKKYGTITWGPKGSATKQ